MSKTLMGPKTLLYPTPSVIIGAHVDGKPNFMTAAWCGVVNSNPPMLSVAIQPRRHTHKGVTQNSTFSINIPGVDLVKEADYCGIASGAKVDKAAICGFKLFYGKLDNAPLIEQCPVNLECTVVHTLKLGSHTLFIGQVEETHISEDCLTDGQPDVDKMKPFIFLVDTARQYRAFGEVIAKAFSAGRDFSSKE